MTKHADTLSSWIVLQGLYSQRNWDDFGSKPNKTPQVPRGLATFNWDTKVKDILPEQWGLKEIWASEMANIGNIFVHASGLPSWVY